MSIQNGYGNLGAHSTAPLTTAGGGASASTAPPTVSLPSSAAEAFALLGITDFKGDGEDDLEFTAQDLSELLNKLLGEEDSPGPDINVLLGDDPANLPDMDALLGDSPANTSAPTLPETPVSSSRLSSSFLALDAIADQDHRARLESEKSTFDKVKDGARSVANHVKTFFHSKPVEAGKATAEVGMAAVSAANSAAKHVSSALIEAGSAASVALPGVGAVLGLAEIAMLNQKMGVLDNRLTNLQYILEHDIPNIPINKADPQAVADLKKLEDATRYATSQLASRRNMVGILLAGTVVSTTGTAVVMLSGATGMGAAVGAGIGIVGSTTRQIPLLKRMVRYVYKKATDTLGVERSTHAKSLISSARHWHPSIASCADNVLIHIGATKNFQEEGITAHQNGLDSDLLDELQNGQVTAIVERKLRSSP
jgi:hypothetical protein